MTSYSFRAEFAADLEEFKELVGDKVNMKVSKDPITIEGMTEAEAQKFRKSIPDVDVVMTSELSLEKLREIMEEVLDGHVMLETLNYTSEYTGERYYTDY